MADAAAKEPSMEEILASIRRIIAEDGEEVANDSAATPEPELDRQSAAAAPANDPAPIVGLDDALRPAISVTSERSAAPVVEEVVSSPKIETAPPAASNLPNDVQAEKAVPPKTGQTMSLANIAAGIKRPATAGQSEPEPIADKPTEAVKPVSAPETPAPQGAASAQVPPAPDSPQSRQSEAQVLKVRLSNPDRPPEQFVSRVREAQEIAEQKKQADEAASFKGALMSPDATDEVSGSFERLRKSQETFADDLDLEAQTERLLRKMLREWLDENLPTMVERLVREEIERVARG